MILRSHGAKHVKIKSVSIIGLGLLGSSLGLALKEEQSYNNRGYDSDPTTRSKAIELDLVDEVHHNSAEAARDADLVYCCTTWSHEKCG